MVAVAPAPAGDRTVTGRPGPRPGSLCHVERGEEHAASAQPAPRRSAETGGPATATSSTTRPGATEATARAQRARSGEPGVHGHADHPEPSALTPAAIGGRLGPEPDDVLP